MLEDLHATTKSILEQFLADPRTTSLRDRYCEELHIAALVKRGRVIASARNRYGTRSRGSGFSKSSLHAERNVIKELGDISLMKGADMIVMRFSKNRNLEDYNRFRCSKPCTECQVFLEKCMREYGLKNVYYTG
jgi:hypothetical protein